MRAPEFNNEVLQHVRADAGADRLRSRLAAWLRRGLLALGLLAGAAACDAAEAGKPLLWEVRSPTSSVYVLGSIHVARQDFYPLPQVVEDAYRKADELVVEIDVSDPDGMAKAIPLLTYMPPDGLDRHLPPDVWRRLQALAPSGQSAAMLRPIKPGMLSSMLAMGALQKHGYAAQDGIDAHFLESAHADHKRVAELESFEFQAAILGGLTDEEGGQMIREILDEIGSGELVSQTDRLAAAWKAGDDEAIGRLLREANKDPASKKIFAKLFDERNSAMADKIAALAAQPEHALVVIGAGHLIGARNVLELLQARGLQVRRVPSSP